MFISTTLLSLLLLLNTATTFYEPSDSSKQYEYDYFMQNSKSQKTAANILMVTGIVAGSATLGAALGDAVGDVATTLFTLGSVEPEHHSYTVPALLSIAAIVGGIILYSAASRNKKIAKGISLDIGMGSSPLLQQQSVKNYTYPSLSLKIKL